MLSKEECIKELQRYNKGETRYIVTHTICDILYYLRNPGQQAQSGTVECYAEAVPQAGLLAEKINADHITKHIANEIETTLKIAFCFDSKMAGIDKESIIKLASKLKDYFSKQTV